MNHSSKLLEQVPRILLPKEITSARLIIGGLNNRNILINEKWLVKEYLMRDETNDPVYLRFLRERDILLLLNRNHYAPQLLKYYDDGTKFFITREWVEGHTFTTDQLQGNVELFVNAITSIHSISESTSGDFHYYDVIKRYLLEYKGMERHYPTSPSLDRKFLHFPSYKRVDRFFIDHIHQLQSINSVKPLVRIHGDMVFSNIILTPKKPKIVFIDWEYSTLADPCIDLAYFITQNQLPHNFQQTLVQKFDEKLGFQIPPKILELTCNLMNLMSGLWYVIQAARLKSIASPLIRQQSSDTDFISLAQDKFSILGLFD